MSLMRFLAVGRSIGSVQNEPSRYRMDEQNLLPKFGGIADDALRSRESWQTTAKLSSKAVIREPRSQPQRAPLVSVEISSGNMSGHSIAGQSQRQPSGASFWRPWQRLRDRFKKRPRTAGVQVQGELALDTIRPICNDLCDSDLELVPQREERPAPALPTVVKTESGTKLFWGRMRGRWFGVREA